MSVVVHWDVENQQVPAGSSVASVCNRIRAVLLERFDCISGLYAYMDVTREKDKIRTQLAMMGYDIIDCSSASGKTGQVDLRIIARALSPAVPNAPKQIVCLISGDGDFAYAMSTLRNTRTQTVLIYNSDTRSIVNTNLIEATDVAIGLPFSGDASETADANDDANADAAASSAPSGASTLQHPSNMDELLIEAVVRSPSVDDEDWRITSFVGSMFYQLAPHATSKNFRLVKKALIAAKRLQVRREGAQIKLCDA